MTFWSRAVVRACCLAFPLLVGSSGCGKDKQKIPRVADSQFVPSQQVSASTIYCYRGPHKVWKLESEELYKMLNDTGSALAVPVTLTIYDSTEENTTVVLADSGRTTKALDYFFVWGNVFIKNWDGLRVWSESLWWNKETQRVGSDDYVKIRTPTGDILRGKGLDGSETFSWWSLREDVSGAFPNFRERMDSDDL